MIKIILCLLLALITHYQLLLSNAAQHQHYTKTNHNHELQRNTSGQQQQRQQQQQTRGLRTHPVQDEMGHDFASFEEFAKSDEFKKQNARCSQRSPTEKEDASSQRLVAGWLETHPNMTNNNRRTQEIVPKQVQVYFHVMRHTNGAGGVSDDMIEDSIDVLNKAYSPYFEFIFNLDTDVDYKKNSAYYQILKEGDMKKELHKGHCSDLNIYTVKPTSSVLGWATFPWDCKTNFYMDGVIIHENTLPGGGFVPYHLGHTLVHEVGHWLGLFHTFEGGCSTVKGEVDTAPEKYPAFGCPKSRNSCGGDDGVPDPVTNFMDYSDDDCMEEFTDGQFVRMLAMWDEIRDASPAGDDCSGDDVDELDILINTDAYGEETTWVVTNNCNSSEVLSGGPYERVQEYNIKYCLPHGEYTFEIRDKYEDGICCVHGKGSYAVKYKGSIIKEGAEFGAKETATFGSCPVDSEQQLSEKPTGKPTESPSQMPTKKPTVSPAPRVWERIFAENFERNYYLYFKRGGYNAGNNRKKKFAHSGKKSLWIRDGDGTKSAIISKPIDVSDYDMMQVKFWFNPWSMKATDGFILEYANNDDGSSAEVTEHMRWMITSSNGLTNYKWYKDTQNIDVTNINSIIIRFRCIADSNRNIVFLDDIEVVGRKTA